MLQKSKRYEEVRCQHRLMHQIAYAFTDVKYLEVYKWAIRESLQFFHQN